MIMADGTETNRLGEPGYNFFADEIFGLEKPLQQIVEYFHSAAQRLEVRKRILTAGGEAIAGTRRGSPADLAKFVEGSDNTLVIPTK